MVGGDGDKKREEIESAKRREETRDCKKARLPCLFRLGRARDGRLYAGHLEAICRRRVREFEDAGRGWGSKAQL